MTDIQANKNEDEIDAYFEQVESEAWERHCRNMVEAERTAHDYKAWLADDYYVYERFM